jgi:hypothetical protein
MKRITRPLPVFAGLLALMLTAPVPSAFGVGPWRTGNRRAHTPARTLTPPRRHRTHAVVAAPFNRALGPGSWCWFASPQALRIGAQTIAGYVDAAGDIVVVSLVAGVKTHTYVLHADLQIDDHATPTFWERPDGRIVAFYSKHAIGSPLHRVSVNLGTTPGAGDGGHNTDRPYARYTEADKRTYIAFTNAHPQSRPTNIYLMVRRGAAWYSITGQPQTIPASPGGSSMVFNAVARGLRAWVWDVEVAGDGDPVVV